MSRKALAVLSIIFLMLVMTGCREEGKMEKRKLLFIGIDGADPDVLDKMMEEGKLPNIKKLTESGSYGRLDTVMPAQSPVAWTSIATGVNPGKHNIFDFIRRDPKSYLPILSLAKSEAGIAGTSYTSYVKAVPFFQITSKNNIPTTVVKWPMTFPPMEVKGNLLAGLGVPDIKGLLNSYRYYTTEDPAGAGAEKVIKVEVKDNIINTEIGGPRKREEGRLVDITEPMQIRLEENKAVLIINGREYPVHEKSWTDWIQIKFKAGFMNDVYGICRAYLDSAEPFSMYLTSVQIDPEHPVQQISWPRKYSAELAEELGLYNTLGLPEDTNALNEGRLDDASFMEQCGQIEEERMKMFWKEFDRFESGALVFVFDTSDRVQHMFWDDRIIYDPEDGLQLSKEIEDYFIEKDRFIGEVMGRIDNNTALMIVSDHGFTSFERCINVNTWLYENGYMVLKEEPSEDRLGELFSLVDWENTKAYSVGFGSIYINLEGREGKGTVGPDDKDRIVDEIVSGLEKLKDPMNNRTAITKVHKASEDYSGAYAGEAPDMIIGFAPGYRTGWQNAIGGVTPDIFFDNEKHWRGDHIVDPQHIEGTFISNFGISRKPHQLDVAPTVLSLLGLEVPEDMDGESLIK